ncbi:MAG: tail fiber domain-containing protein [Plesiomonas shigelloides]
MTVLATGLTTEHKNEVDAHPISSISGLQAALDSKVSTGGGTLTGALRGTTLEMSGTIRSVGTDLVGIRMLSANGYGYLQAGHATDDANQKLAITGHSAKYLTEIYARVRGGVNPYMLDELGNKSNFYSERNKPNATDVGAVPASRVIPNSGAPKWLDILDKIPLINSSGVTELGRYIDLRGAGRDVDYDWRIDGGNLDYNGLDFYNATGVKAFHLTGSTGDAQALRDLVAGRALRVNSPIHPTMELHATGKFASMMRVDSGNGDTSISKSNGAGVENQRLVKWDSFGIMYQQKSLLIPSAGAAWGASNPYGGIAPLDDDIHMAVGEWHPLITSPRYAVTGQGYQTRWQIGHYRNVANNNGQFVINMTGDGLLKNNLRYNFNASGQFGVEGTQDGSTYSLHSGGHLSGTIFGNFGTMVSWCQASFAPISDKKLKKNIKPATKSALEDVAKIDFVSYEWIDNRGSPPPIGVTAQQMASIGPCYARDVETFKVDGDIETSVKVLDLVNCLSLALKGVAELIKITERQGAEIENLAATLEKNHDLGGSK